MYRMMREKNELKIKHFNYIIHIFLNLKIFCNDINTDSEKKCINFIFQM